MIRRSSSCEARRRGSRYGLDFLIVRVPFVLGGPPRHTQAISNPRIVPVEAGILAFMVYLSRRADAPVAPVDLPTAQIQFQRVWRLRAVGSWA